MARVIGDISISLDGYVTGPDPGPDNGLGDGGAGTPLFHGGPPRVLRQLRVRQSAPATHLTYRVD